MGRRGWLIRESVFGRMGGVQGSSRSQRDVLDVQSVAGHLLAAGSVFGFLAEHRLELFPPEMFEDLFPSRRGRPSVPAEVVASVIVLQTLHGHSDREAVEALTFDLRWKAACGYPVDAAGFHPTVLTLWRRRLAASGSPQRIFEAVREVIEATGALAGKTRRAVDSTILDDAVARQDTVTQLVAAIRRVARDVPDGAQVVMPAAPGMTTPARGNRISPGTTPMLGRRWFRRWSTTLWRCWMAWTWRRSPRKAARRPRRWRCWAWWRGRTWSRPKAPMAPTAGGGSPGKWPRTG